MASVSVEDDEKISGTRWIDHCMAMCMYLTPLNCSIVLKMVHFMLYIFDRD